MKFFINIENVVDHPAFRLDVNEVSSSEWSYPEIQHDTPTCMKLLLEGIAWSLSGFFGEGQSGPETAPAATSP